MGMIKVEYQAGGELGALKVPWFAGKSPGAVAVECADDYFLRVRTVPKNLTVRWPDGTKSAFDIDIEAWTFTATLR